MVQMELYRVFSFCRTMHISFRPPGFPHTTAVLSTAIKETHCIFGRIIILTYVQKFLLLWMHFHASRTLWMEGKSYKKVCIVAQGFNASIQAVNSMFLLQRRKHGCLVQEGTGELATETSSNSTTIASRMLINAATAEPLNRTCTSMRVVDDNLSGD
jgi:hypothetical protein